MSDLKVNTIGDSSGSGPVATLPTSGGSAFTLGPNWGVMEFVSETSITAVTNLDVTSLVSGYDYIVGLFDAIPDTDGATIEARFSQSASFLTGANYTDVGGSGATSITVNGLGTGSAAGEFMSGEWLLSNPGGTGNNKTINNMFLQSIKSDGTMRSSGEFYGTGQSLGAYTLDQDAIDGVRFFCSSGDWEANGTIRLFRRRLS